MSNIRHEGEECILVPVQKIRDTMENLRGKLGDGKAPFSNIPEADRSAFTMMLVFLEQILVEYAQPRVSLEDFKELKEWADKYVATERLKHAKTAKAKNSK